MSDILQLAPGETLIKEGDVSTQMFFLKDGTLAVYKVQDGEEVQIGAIYAGEVVGEMSFLDKKQRCATVKAISDCTLSVIPAEKFEKIFEGLPIWYKALINTLLDRLRRANEKVTI